MREFICFQGHKNRQKKPIPKIFITFALILLAYLTVSRRQTGSNQTRLVTGQAAEADAKGLPGLNDC